MCIFQNLSVIVRVTVCVCNLRLSTHGQMIFLRNKCGSHLNDVQFYLFVYVSGAYLHVCTIALRLLTKSGILEKICCDSRHLSVWLHFEFVRLFDCCCCCFIVSNQNRKSTQRAATNTHSLLVCHSVMSQCDLIWSDWFSCSFLKTQT